MKPGDDLSYYLGPSAKKATRAQVAELRKTFGEAHAGNLLRVLKQLVDETDHCFCEVSHYPICGRCEAQQLIMKIEGR